MGFHYEINQGKTGEFLTIGAGITYTYVELDIVYTSNGTTSGVAIYEDYGTPGDSYYYAYGAANNAGGSGWNVAVNGVSQSITTALPSGTKLTLRLTTTSSAHTTTISSGGTHVGSDSGTSRYANLKIYGLRYYNAGTLVANFDLTTGSFTEQLGTGKTLTPTGGTWVNDGTTNNSIVTDGLLLYLNSQQGVSGSTWQNIAPNATGSNGTITNASVGTFNGSTGMVFNGTTNTHVDIPVPTALQSVTSATLEMRVNMSSAQSSNGTYPDLITSTDKYLLFLMSGAVRLTGIFDATRTDPRLAVSGVFTDNVDNYITITADVPNKLITVYINGISKGSYSPTTMGTFVDTTTFSLGNNPSADGSMPNGIIDNVRLYNRVLTQAEITQNYSIRTAVGLSGSGTTGSTKFDLKQTIYNTSLTNFDSKQAIYQTGLQNFDSKQTLYNTNLTNFDTTQSLYQTSSQNYDSKQVLFNTSVSNYDMEQSIYNVGANDFDVRQNIYDQSSILYDSKQSIYQTTSTLFDTLQEIYADGIVGSTLFDLKLNIYSTGQSSFDLKQSLYNTSLTGFSTKQSIYNQSSFNVDTKQSLYSQSNYQIDTKQVIYQVASTLFDTLQQIYDGGIIGSSHFDTKLVLYADRQSIYDTKQSIYQSGVDNYDLKQAIYQSSQSQADMKLVLFTNASIKNDMVQKLYSEDFITFDTLQTIFDPDHKIIGTVNLKGNQELNVYLLGMQQLNINLIGKQVLDVILKGVIK